MNINITDFVIYLITEFFTLHSVLQKIGSCNHGALTSPKIYSQQAGGLGEATVQFQLQDQYAQDTGRANVSLQA